MAVAVAVAVESTAEPRGHFAALPLAMPLGDWKVAPRQSALGVGPTPGDISWWSNSQNDVDTQRACYFDDVYRFASDGSFHNVQGAETYLDAWANGGQEGCGAPVCTAWAGLRLFEHKSQSRPRHALSSALLQ